MTTLNDFKQLRASVSAEVQKELYSLFSSNPDAARQRMVELAAEQGVTLSVEQVREFLKQMNEESEFDDIELDAVALAAVAGGQMDLQGSAHDLDLDAVNDRLVVVQDVRQYDSIIVTKPLKVPCCYFLTRLYL